MISFVKKRDGSLVPFDPDKMNKWAEYASNSGVNWSAVVLNAIRKVEDGCSTSDLHDAMIDACVDKKDSAHLQMAARLLVGKLNKEVHGDFEHIPDLATFYHTMVKSGLWVNMSYDESELDALNEVVDHQKDFTYPYTVLKQIIDKYAIKNRITNKVYETPQFVFMGIAMYVMEHQPEDRRLEDVEKLYIYLSDLKINASTPFLNGPRTGFEGFASCCVIKGGDTADSIEAAIHAAYRMTCAQAGIGIVLDTRSIGDAVRDGSVSHMG